ncbi:MAG: hypothetical protein OXG15_15825 [Gammaproteobacteria bacterium]|nr:hypothetical protein [Gammaproteobacteria bacterium]
MSILESTFAGGMETAIKTRVSFDSKARQALERLEGRSVQFNMSGQDFHLKVVDGHVEVRPDNVEDPDLEITGSMSSISQALMTSNTNNIALHGDETILDELHVIFGPPLDPKDVADKAKAARDYGIAAARSAMETISAQFADISTRGESVVKLEERVAELEARVDELQRQLAESTGRKSNADD